MKKDEIYKITKVYDKNKKLTGNRISIPKQYMIGWNSIKISQKVSTEDIIITKND